MITIFVNLGLFRHFETVTNMRTWIKSHRYWRCDLFICMYSLALLASFKYIWNYPFKGDTRKICYLSLIITKSASHKATSNLWFSVTSRSMPNVDLNNLHNLQSTTPNERYPMRNKERPQPTSVPPTKPTSTCHYEGL